MTSRLKFFASALGLATLLAGAASAQVTVNETINPSLVQQGFAISPIPKSCTGTGCLSLNLQGKNLALVGYGSYLVNATGDCTGCHTFPRFYRAGGPGSKFGSRRGSRSSRKHSSGKRGRSMCSGVYPG